MLVRIFCDWVGDAVLWFDGPLDPTDLDIPRELVSRMEAWRDFWLQNTDDLGGWNSPDLNIQFLLEGHRLWQALDSLRIPGVTFVGSFDPECG